MRIATTFALLAAVALLTGCKQAMEDHAASEAKKAETQQKALGTWRADEKMTVQLGHTRDTEKWGVDLSPGSNFLGNATLTLTEDSITMTGGDPALEGTHPYSLSVMEVGHGQLDLAFEDAFMIDVDLGDEVARRNVRLRGAYLEFSTVVDGHTLTAAWKRQQ